MFARPPLYSDPRLLSLILLRATVSVRRLGLRTPDMVG